MLRYLFPATLLVTALLVLFAHGFGDLQPRPKSHGMLVPVVGKPPSVTPSRSARPPAKPATPATASVDSTARADELLQRKHDALQAQVDNLQSDVARESQQLASLRARDTQEKQDLDALTKQRQDAEASLARLKAQRHEASSAAAAHSSTVSEPTGPASRGVAVANRESGMPPPSPVTTLATAQNALMRGRPDEARQQLALAETQLAFRSVTPDQPLATGSNVAATNVRDAIRWLDVGNTQQALQLVNLALANAQLQSESVGASATPLSSGYYAYPGQPSPYGGSGWR